MKNNTCPVGVICRWYLPSVTWEQIKLLDSWRLLTLALWQGLTPLTLVPVSLAVLCQLHVARLSDLSEISDMTTPFTAGDISSEVTQAFCFTQLHACHDCGINSPVKRMLWKAEWFLFYAVVPSNIFWSTVVSNWQFYQRVTEGRPQSLCNFENFVNSHPGPSLLCSSLRLNPLSINPSGNM